jgi:DNA-binding HxlR family transcriptional regulator
VVRELLFAHPQPLRFGELVERLPGISRTLLTSRLRELEAAGIVQPHTNGAARAIGGWSLTERGASLADVLRAMGSWSIEHLADPAADPRSVRLRLSSLG